MEPRRRADRAGAGAEGTFLYPSGVAAIAATLLTLLSPGDAAAGRFGL
ncbi:hypothetical protein AB5I41_15495 [Sphingomonas sp. MMS24-JH45]